MSAHLIVSRAGLFASQRMQLKGDTLAGAPWRTRLAVLLAAVVLSACGSLPPNTARTASTALPDSTATPLSALVDQSRPAGATARNDTGLRLLGSVESAFGSRMALIENATRTLDLQYYSIHYDASTVPLLEGLRQAARRGVRVRVLIDDFNAAGPNAEVLRLDLEPGIEVRTFNPLTGPRRSQAGRLLSSLVDFERIQKRMHNKLFIADSALAIAGGRNLGDEYFGQGATKNFLDLDVLVAGRMVGQLARSFDRYWADLLAYPVRTLLTESELDHLKKPAPPPDADGQAPGRLIGSSAAGSAASAGGRTVDAPGPAPATPRASALGQPDAPAGAEGVDAASVPGATNIADDIATGRLRLHWAPATLLVDAPEKIAAEEPDDSTETVIDGVMRLVEKTQGDLLVVSPYFVPGDGMLQTFRSLVQRGVKVRVLTNSLASNDAPLAHAGYARWRVRLLEAGVALYEMRTSGGTRRRLLGSSPQSQASLHAKALVQDGQWLVIGSMNLDLRSQLQNSEVALVIRSRALSRDLAENIEKTIGDSYRVDLLDGQLRWHAPPDDDGTTPTPLTSDPDASAGVRLLLKVIGPLAPDELL